MKSPTSRRQSRELALQVLFQQEFSPQLDFRTGLETFRANFAAPVEVWQYAETLLSGIHSHHAAIDQLLQSHASNWSLPRMALVDLSLMRIAIFEMNFAAEAIPPAIAINEAVELAKKYGTAESAKFVNGILDQAGRSKA
ncbi:MAG: transcription antitermination factor NusB [Bdellovibrionales bacterium]|nr:transcription antitermination factor NusB [Bdellovibrionales bacterium]